MSAGSLTLGGNLSIAVGPLGRNGEAIGSVSSKGKVAAMCVYLKYSMDTGHNLVIFSAGTAIQRLGDSLEEYL